MLQTSQMPYIANLVEGIEHAATANISTLVINSLLVDEASRVLAILQLLAVTNVGQFGSLTALTGFDSVQQSVQVISEPALLAVSNALENQDPMQSPAPGVLLWNIIEFVEMVEYV